MHFGFSGARPQKSRIPGALCDSYGMKIYIAGKITGDKHYRRKFARAERMLRKLGYSVMNPAWIRASPEFDWDDYMAVSGAMQERCDGVYFLADWEESEGARAERDKALERGQFAMFDTEVMADVLRRGNLKKKEGLT